MRYKNLIPLLIAGLLIAFISNALATGDGRLLRRSLEDTCQGCHKTDKNARFLPNGSVNPESIKTHNSDWAGTCSNSSFLNRFDCEANNETWTNKWSAQGGWGKEGTKYGAIVCTTCHTTHSTRNIYLIRQTIKTPDNSNWPSGTNTVNVDFRYFSGTAGVTPGLMGDDTGGHATSTRICEVCHSQTKYHRYNTAGQESLDHQNATDCTVCHKHKKGFNPDFAASCGDCHGYPISNNEVTKGSNGLVVNDTQYAPAGETGRRAQFVNTAKGAHVTHFNKNIGCSSCHYEGKSGAPPDPKFDSKIQIGFYLSGTALGGIYKAPAFIYNTHYSIQATGTTTYQADPSRTCSNLYCHSDGGNYAGTITYRTISWDTTLSTPTCDKCHGNQAGIYVTTDKHPQHINPSTYNYKCYECHANTTDANNNISGTDHVNRAKDVAWRTNSASMNPDAGPYSRPNCSNNYCHSLGTKGSAPYDNPNTTAAWNGGSLDCSGCHGGNSAKTNKMNTMAHLAHINDTSNQVGWNIGCRECHLATVSADETLSSYTRHVDKKLQVKFDNSLNRNSDNPLYNGVSSTGSGGAEKAAGASGYTCSNVYCHSIGNLDGSGNVVAAGGASFRSIAWNAPAINCSGCHGDSGSNKSHPIYTSGTAGSTTANSHVKHVDDNNYGCDYCHLTTTTSPSLPPTSVIQGGAHLNRIENVAFKAVSGQTGSYNSSTKTCSSTYCHGSSNLVWGDAGATNCATCHDSQGAGGAALYTPKHLIHVDVAGYNYSCEMCHAVSGTNHAVGPASGTNPGGDPVGPNQTTEIGFTSLSGTGWTTGNYRGSASSYKYRSMTKDPYTNNNISPIYADGTNWSTDSTNPGIKYTTDGTCNNIWCHSNAAPGGSNTFKSVVWNATLNCGSCHNQAGDASPNWTSLHTKHINTYTQYTCNHCHATVAANNTTISSKALHVNALKEVAFNTWTGGTWSGTQCSNTYCHSKGTTLTGPFSHSAISWTGTVGCGGCHGEGAANGNPSYTNGSPKANSHVKHVTGSGQTCDYCHANVVNASNVITSTSLHVNKAYNVDMLLVGGRTGTYDSGAKTCANTYCHGTPPSVAWGGTTNCASCHGANNNGDLSVSTTAGHALHYNITALPTTMTSPDAHTSTAYAYACQSCHPTASHSTGPVSGNQDAQVSGTKMTTYTPGGTSYTDTRGFKYTYGTCTTVCHTRDGVSGAPIVAAVWNGAKTTPNCGVCHNKAGDASPVWTSLHTKHVNTYTQYTCNHCHATVAADNTTLVSGTAARQLHPNASKEVVFNTWTGGTWSGTQCSNTYCHSNGTSTSGTHAAISWTGTTTCSSCHLSSTIATNAHQAHVNNVSRVGYQIGCAECHASVVSNNTTISSFTRHVDKLTNVKFDNIINPNSDNPTFNGVSTTGADGATRTVGGAATAACNNLYCHSNGNINGATPTFVSVAWNGSINCTGCHGDGSTKAHSVFANGGAGSATANSHVKHVEGSSLGCDFCHIGTTTDTALLPTTVLSGTRHLNRIEDVEFKLNGGRTGTYNSGAKTCANTYCHGTPPSVAWGGTTNCASCHGANNNGDLSVSTTAGHALHYNITALPTTMTSPDAHTSTAYAYACQSCHPTASHSTGPVSGNQDAQVSGTKMTTYTPGGTSYTDTRGFKYTYGTCTTVCHTRDGVSGAPIVAAVWNGAKTTPNCGVCHNKAGDASPVWTVLHTKHINTYTQYTCNHCHATVAADNTTLVSGTTARQLHPNASKEVVFNTWTGGTWSGTQCSNTYCHSKGTTLTGPFSHSAISWTGTVGCGGCHGEGAANGNPSYTNGSPKANSHVKHVTGSGQTCDYCHANVVNASNVITSTTLHVNKAYNVDMLLVGGRTGTYNSGAKTCANTYCHGTPPSVAWGGTTNCASCHGANNNGDLSVSTTAGHALHYNITALPTTMTSPDAHTSTAYAYACQSCHPTASHSTGPVSANQDAQVSGTKMTTYTPGGTSYTDTRGFKYTYGTCTTVCHTRDGVSGAPIVAAVWNGAKTTPNCGVCHNKAGDASPVWTVLHTKHINTYTQYTCNHCHATVAADNTTLVSGTTARQLHPNASKNVAFNTWTGGTWSGTQCSNTYCHSNGTSTSTGASPTHAAISWTGTTTCSSCHTGPTTGPNYANGTPKANSHAKHTAAPWNYICNECHASVVNSSNLITSATLHANKAYTVNSAKIGSYTPVTPPSTAGGTCTNVTCHGNNTNPHAWGATLKCSDCHAGTSDVDNWLHDGIVSKISSTQWSYSGHGKTSGTYDVTGNPAANFPGAAGSGDPCLYCHLSTAEHNITGTTNPIRLSNLNWNARGNNGNCMICHETGSPGYDPDGAGSVYALKNATKKIDKYHYGAKHSATYSGGQYCWDCHDPHGDSSSTSGPIVMIHLRPASKSDTYGKPTEVASVDVVFTSKTNGSDFGATASPFNKICNVCHTQTTYYRNNLGANGHYTDTCTSCHSHSSNTTYNGDAFSGAGGESAGGTACGTCHSAIFNRMNDSTANVVYKHYMNNANATNTVIAQPATLGTTADTNRRCLTCHVDHNIFRPDLNANGARAKNLRLDISMTPSTTAGFTDTDYDSTAANGGICLSCHYTQQTKAVATNNGTTIVPAIPFPNAGTISQARDIIRNSTHNYAVASGTFKDNSSFKAVCLKCHDDTLTKQYQTGTGPKFGLHQSGRNTLSAVMGSASFKDFVSGKVTAATATTITTDQNLTKSYAGYHVVVTKADGTLSQRVRISSNTTGANATITVASWPSFTPANNDFFEIVMKITPVEDMCFSCHSQGSNSTGTVLDKPNAYKANDGKDYYNTATMINKLEQMFNLFNADSGRLRNNGNNVTTIVACTNSTASANEFTGYILRMGSVVKTVTSNTATSSDATCNTNYGLPNSLSYSWTGAVTLTAGTAYKVAKPATHPLDTLGRHTPDEHIKAPSTRPASISQAWNVGDTGGIATATSSTSITDTAKMWNANRFTNLRIYFTSGSCSEQSSTITGNTATVINFSSFGCTPAVGDGYYIGKRHVSCTDCHNTHAAQPNPAGTVSSATNTPPGNITIKDNEKTLAKTGWASNKWKGYLIMVTKASGFRQIRQITTSTTDATGTTYQVGLAWNTTFVPAAGDRYEVFKQDGTTPPSGKGTWGVQITFTTPTTRNTGENFAPASTYTYTKVYDSPYQRDLCMKCHSYYGFLNAPPSNVSGIGTINTIRPATDIAEEANPYNLGHHAIYDRGRNQPLTVTGSTAKTGKYGFNPNWPKYTVGTVSIATNGVGTLFGGALPQNVLPGWMMYIGSTNFPASSATTVPAGWYEIVEIVGSTSFRVTPGPSSALSDQEYALTAGLGNTFIPPYGPWAILKCTDCHGSKLSDPAGPHASTNKFLMKDLEPTIGYEFFNGTTTVVTTAYNSAAPNLRHFCHNCHSANTYGHQNLTGPPVANYSRVSHTKIYAGDVRVSTATYVTTEISCHMCHAVFTRGSGGADLTDRVGGIHGSNYYNKGTGSDNANTFYTSAQGKRLLNGATWLNGTGGAGAQGVKRPTTTQVGTCYTRTTTTDALNRCNTGHDNRASIGTAEYDYDNP